MSSYFDFFCESIESGRTQETDSIKGTCFTMCPQEEVIMRNREKLVHVLEVVNKDRKLVKSFSRSAADSNMAVPKVLRPYSILKNTVQYLLLEVTKRTDVPEPVLYDFLCDRLRSVRQDMTIQRLPPEECQVLLEPMIRFHIYFGCILCKYSLNNFDPVLNKKYLLECMKWYLYCCDLSESVDNITGFISNMELNIKQLCNDRVLIESAYILVNLDNLHPLLRYLKLPKDMKRATPLQLAYKIAIANLKGNYVRVSRLSEHLCPLSYCALFISLPEIQRRTIHVLSVSYSSKQLSVPAATVAAWAGCAGAGDAATVCAHYGLTATREHVAFQRGMFRSDVAVYRPKTCSVKYDIENILTYYSKK